MVPTCSPDGTKMEPTCLQNGRTSIKNPCKKLGPKKGRKMKVADHRIGSIFDRFMTQIKKTTREIGETQIGRKHEHNANKIPKWSQYQCQTSSKSNAKTGNGKNHSHYQKPGLL